MVGALAPKPWINKGASFLPFGLIERFEKQYAAIYVTDSAVEIDVRGELQPVALFWQPVKPQPDYDHYFLISRRTFTYYISTGRDLSKEWLGYQAKSGEIIYSRYRGDYRESEDGTAFSDMKLHNGTPVPLGVREGEVVILE